MMLRSFSLTDTAVPHPASAPARPPFALEVEHLTEGYLGLV